MAGRNEAYDLELFQPREPRLVALKNDVKATRDSNRRARRQSLINTVVYLSLALVALAMVGYFITGNVRLTEMNKEYADTLTRQNELQSENVRLKSNLAALTSPEKVNAYAVENGMQQADSSQIHYVTINEEDKVSLSQKEDNWFAQAWDAVVDFFT